jgi:hypothetical protein
MDEMKLAAITPESAKGYAAPRPNDRLSSFIESAKGVQEANSALKSLSR